MQLRKKSLKKNSGLPGFDPWPLRHWDWDQLGAGQCSQMACLLKLRTCLHGGGEPQVGEVTRFGG